MQVFFLVLNKTECLDAILENMLENGFGGATILNSTGMMRVLETDDNVNLPMLGLLRQLYSPERKTSQTMFTLIEEDRIPELVDIINKATGGINKPDTGICFAMPVTFVEGLKK